MEILAKMVELYFEQIKEVAKFNKLILLQLIHFYYDSEKIQKVFQAMDEVNDVQLELTSDVNGIALSPKKTLAKALGIRTVNQDLLDVIQKIPMMDRTPQMAPIFEKLTKNSNNIIIYVDDLIRTYLVNIPDQMKEDYFDTVQGEELSKLMESFETTISLKPNDSEAKKVYFRLQMNQEAENRKDKEEDYSGQK